MDYAKLENLIAAIEQEKNQPSPSHQNLARLTALALKELVSVFEQQKDLIMNQLLPLTARVKHDPQDPPPLSLNSNTQTVTESVSANVEITEGNTNG